MQFFQFFIATKTCPTYQGFNATEELNAGSKYPNIRLMTPAEVESDVPLDDFQTIEQPWSLPSAGSFVLFLLFLCNAVQ